MDVRQISIRYDADQDRILVSVNTHSHEEIQMWLTRRLLVGLWPLLNQIVAKHFALPANARTDGFLALDQLSPATRQHLVDFQRQTALEQSDFGTPYQDTALHHPMGSVPLLVSEVNLTPRDGEQMQLNFKEQVDGSQRGFQLDLQADLLYSVMELLHQALQQSDWMAGSSAAAPTVVVESRDEDADERGLALGEKRPRYLN